MPDILIEISMEKGMLNFWSVINGLGSGAWNFIFNCKLQNQLTQKYSNLILRLNGYGTLDAT